MKRASQIAIIAMAFLAFVCPPASAQEEEGKGVEVSLSGYYRVRHYYIDDVWMSDAYGHTLNTNSSYFQQRVRLEPTVRVSENVKLIGQIDIFDDVIWGNNNAPVPVLAGAPTSQGPDGYFADDQFGIRSINPKRFYADVLLPFGKLEFGRMPSHWGLGLLENDGNGFRNEWGDAHYGTTHDRILFATKPMGKEGPMILAIAFDKTVTSNADKLAPGSIDASIDDVDQIAIVPVYHPEDKQTTAGIFAAYRSQNSTKTQIYAASGYCDVDLEPLRLQAEAVWVGGETKALMPALLKANDEDNLHLTGKTDVNAINGVLRATYNYEPLKFIVEGGYSSGQEKDAVIPERNSPRTTSKITTYPFNPDYNVGLILFEEVLYRKSLDAAENRFPYPNDERLSLKELIPSHGSVRNAWYVAPLIKLDLTDALGTKLGILYAQAVEDLYDPTSRAAGWTNYEGNHKLSKDLGWEIDWGIHFGLADNFDFGVQLGYFIPGKAFETTSGDTTNVFETQTRLTVTF